jgi:hypothetical protein
MADFRGPCEWMKMPAINAFMDAICSLSERDFFLSFDEGSVFFEFESHHRGDSSVSAPVEGHSSRRVAVQYM